jgi:hypothetical protein
MKSSAKIDIVKQKHGYNGSLKVLSLFLPQTD